MRRDPKDLVAAVIRSARSPNVVGAGIGRKTVGGVPSDECTLTLLVRKNEPGEDVRSSFARGRGSEMPVEVLEVGDVVALMKPRSMRD